MSENSIVENIEIENLSSEEELLPDNTLPELTLVAKISAILFVYSKPLTVNALSDLTDSSVEEIEIALDELSKLYADEIHGFSLVEVAGAYQLRTTPAAKSVVTRLIPPKARRLSKAAAETLAIIAYKQPLQKSEIESIRGVDAMPTLRTLLESKLIRIVGREDSAGQPALYGTTDIFLEKFGLKDLSELPTIREVIELNQEPGEVPVAEDAHSLEESQAIEQTL
ncbi:MAG: SMC-Scp complex subunit ScpB [Proteobacteria bacterium]|nr:SMC-Scp complex subunit ScpB [Pseudomonadota bacterium]